MARVAAPRSECGVTGRKPSLALLACFAAASLAACGDGIERAEPAEASPADGPAITREPPSEPAPAEPAAPVDALEVALKKVEALGIYSGLERPLADVVADEMHRRYQFESGAGGALEIAGSTREFQAADTVLFEAARVLHGSTFVVEAIRPLPRDDSLSVFSQLADWGQPERSQPVGSAAEAGIGVRGSNVISQHEGRFSTWQTAPYPWLSRGAPMVGALDPAKGSYEFAPRVAMGDRSYFEFRGDVKGFFDGVDFASSKDSPLTFLLVDEVGLVYIGGKGTVTLSGREPVELPPR